MKARKSNWRNFKVCSNPSCLRRLRNDQIYHNNGICPYCGNEEKGTITSYKKVIVKYIKYYPWWKFWSKEKEIIGKDKFSKFWLKQNEKKK